MRVSIVIDNYNYGKFLGAAIDSALAQTYSDLEVIVVDDGSTDTSRDVIASYGSRIIPILKENGGQPSAFNAGFDASAGAIVLFLDADDLLSPGAVARVVAAIRQDDVNVQWQMWEIDEEGRLTGELVPADRLVTADHRAEVIRSGPIPLAYPPTSGNAWRREFLKTVMPIPEDGDKHGADAYLCNIAPLFGCIRALPEPQGFYRVHAKSHSNAAIGKSRLWQRDAIRDLERDLRRFETRCDTLEREMRHMGIVPDKDAWMGPGSPREWMTDMLSLPAILDSVIPHGSAYVLIDDNALGGRILSARTAFPFTEQEGEYWGPPADGRAAIRELHRLRALGAEYLVILRSSLWWLDTYAEMNALLRTRCRQVLDDRRAIVFELSALSDAEHRNIGTSAETPRFRSAEYWELRYRKGGTSGAGSYGRLAEFKAEVLNGFVREHGVQTVVEFGCGDGAQLELAQYPHYIGLDISPQAIELCSRKYAGDSSKEFRVLHDQFPLPRADLTLSLDVIYHLVEDDVFEHYMSMLFDASDRFVIVYASNEDMSWPDVHVKHRAFTTWVDLNRPGWSLIQTVKNRHPYDLTDVNNTSFSDFFIFERGAAK
jgi:glycosyltransferase involved in cell wall biosynthesis